MKNKTCKFGEILDKLSVYKDREVKAGIINIQFEDKIEGKCDGFHMFQGLGSDIVHLCMESLIELAKDKD